jgi:hypothetical protein
VNARNFGSFFQLNSNRGLFDDKRKRFIAVNGNDDRKDFSSPVLCLRVEFFTELHYVHTLEPSGGPTGGEGLAAPPLICNLINPAISLAIMIF